MNRTLVAVLLLVTTAAHTTAGEVVVLKVRSQAAPTESQVIATFEGFGTSAVLLRVCDQAAKDLSERTGDFASVRSREE